MNGVGPPPPFPLVPLCLRFVRATWSSKATRSRQRDYHTLEKLIIKSDRAERPRNQRATNQKTSEASKDVSQRRRQYCQTKVPPRPPSCRSHAGQKSGPIVRERKTRDTRRRQLAQYGVEEVVSEVRAVCWGFRVNRNY